MLDNLEKERNLFEMRKMIPDTLDIFGGDDRKDLIEEWNDEKLDDWRGKIYRRLKTCCITFFKKRNIYSKICSHSYFLIINDIIYFKVDELTFLLIFIACSNDLF